MPAQDNHGVTWSDEDLDIIIADYFSMLADEIARRPYVKSHRNAALMTRVGRSHHSVELKHGNISAVLDSLGLPWIPGYKPMKGFQKAIYLAIDRYLTQHPATLSTVPSEPVINHDVESVFVDAPARSSAEEQIPEALRRLVRKFDPAARDQANRNLGKAGEAFVLDVERKRLTEANRPDLAGNVRWVADLEGDGAGYDILSFDRNGADKLIEVKTTNGTSRTPFYLSRNECALAVERPAEWRIYRVHQFATAARVYTIAPPLADSVNLRAETWRASFA